MQKQIVYLIRHGETAWSLSGQHTSITDLPLTENGKKQSEALAHLLNDVTFTKIYCSPLLRARETCEILGYADDAEIEPDLFEWRYGDYEGLTTSEIQKMVKHWSIFTHPCLNGESVSQVAERADRMISKIRQSSGNIALIASGHISRVLAARWLGLNGEFGRFLTLDTASLSQLSYERETPTIKLWNAIPMTL